MPLEQLNYEMNYFRRDELASPVSDTLARYDETVRKVVGPDYPHPIRMRDWELARVLGAVRSVPVGSSVLDTGSFNTYLPLAPRLPRVPPDGVSPDLIWRRLVKGAERKLRLAPPQAPRRPPSSPGWESKRRTGRPGAQPEPDAAGLRRRLV